MEKDKNNTVHLQQALNDERELAHATLESISDGVLRFDQHFTIGYMNPAAERISGWDKGDAIGRHIGEVIHIIDEETREPVDDVFLVSSSLSPHSQSLSITKDNQQMPVEYICVPLNNDDHHTIGFLLVIKDISESQAALKRVLWQSTHDHLTGLVNRQEMEKRLDNSLKRACDESVLSAFMLLDLDQFKIINDTCGHLAGDELLRRITQQIMAQLRSRDTLARLGGDEFGILLERCSPENAYKVAVKIRNVVANYRFVWDEKLFKVGACVGLTAIDHNTQDVAQLLRDADSACYMAKTQGGNAIQVHLDNDEQLTQQKQQMSIIAEVNSALENKRFKLYYQPIIAMQTGQVSHWEVLVRMLNQNQEVLLPQQFLPASERFGYIRPVDHWVVSHAVKELNELHQLGPHRPKLAINLSANTLADIGCKEKLVDLFHQQKNLHEQIMFEITETSALSNIDAINRFIEQLRQFGCQLALDDFGTGVSTYSYLKRLDIDVIKIDGEFVHNISDNPVNQAIVKSVVDIARLMGISTIAEWVDSAQTYEYLSTLGVDAVQGHYLCPPIPSEEFYTVVLSGPGSAEEKSLLTQGIAGRLIG